MDHPQISVLLPVYNGAAWLRECVDSVLAQNLPDFELIVGDDGSQDGSAEIVESYRDSRVRLLRFCDNVGLFANLNRMLKVASAPLVRCLCQDDLLEPECLSREVEAFECSPDLVISICQASEIDESGTQTFEWRPDGAAEILGSALALESFLYNGCIAGNLSTVCFRRASAEAVGGFDESYRFAGDYQMWTKLCLKGALIALNRKLIRMRRHTGRLSLARRAGVEFIRENRRIRTELMSVLSPELRSYARAYVYRRQNVLDFHYFARCFQHAEYSQCLELMRIMGIRDLWKGLGLWLLTLNNHLYRPTPRFSSSPRTV